MNSIAAFVYVLLRVLIAVALGAVAGWLVGSVWGGVAGALALYLGWNLWQLRALAGWLQNRSVADPPSAMGLWSDVVAQVVRLHRRKRFQGGDVSGAAHHHVGIAALVVARPFPNADPGRAVFDGRVHIEILERRLLPRHDHVDVVAAAETMVHDRQQRVGVGWKIDPNHVRLLIDHMVDESRILVRETVVILPPDVRGQ